MLIAGSLSDGEEERKRTFTGESTITGHRGRCHYYNIISIFARGGARARNVIICGPLVAESWRFFAATGGLMVTDISSSAKKHHTCGRNQNTGLYSIYVVLYLLTSALRIPYSLLLLTLGEGYSTWFVILSVTTFSAATRKKTANKRY